MNTEHYLTAIVEHGRRQGWSQNETARQMGINPGHWHRIITGEVGIGTATLRRMMSRFPEFNGLALVFLAASATNGSEGTDRMKRRTVAA